MDVIRTADEGDVEREVLHLSSTRRWLAPLAFVVSVFTMLFAGLKLLVTNWRLTLVQIPPALWIWAAMIDLKAHVLHGHDFTQMSGPHARPRARRRDRAVTMVCFHLNAVVRVRDHAARQARRARRRSGRPRRTPTHDPRLGIRASARWLPTPRCSPTASVRTGSRSR